MVEYIHYLHFIHTLPMVIFSGIVAVILGASFGAAELITKYAREPFSLFGGKPATRKVKSDKNNKENNGTGGPQEVNESEVGYNYRYVMSYLGINMVASLFAYLLILDQDFGFKVMNSNEMSKALIAGTTAMAILRSSILNFTVGNKSYSIGLAAILQAFLKAADREIDRNLSLKAERALKGIDITKFSFAYTVANLPLLCIHTMQGLSLEELSEINNAINDLKANEKACDAAKIRALFLILTKYTGIEALKEILKNKNDELIDDEKVQLERELEMERNRMIHELEKN